MNEQPSVFFSKYKEIMSLSLTSSSTVMRLLLDVRQPPPSFRLEPYVSLLRPTEQSAVQRFHYAKDRAMSLGSALLKYFVVASITSRPWSSIIISRRPTNIKGAEGDSDMDPYGKPCYVPASDDQAGVEFNVSHQAGLVAVIACPKRKDDHLPMEVGIDIVCVHERDESVSIDRQGFDGWVRIHEEVFSATELDDMTYHLPSLRLDDGRVLSAQTLGEAARCCTRNITLSVTVPGRQARHDQRNVMSEEEEEGQEVVLISSNNIIEAKLRRFYTFWALKEAYVKLTGEALLAPWLKQVEFRNVRSPMPSVHLPLSSASGTLPLGSKGDARNEKERRVHGDWGEVVQDVQIWKDDHRLVDVYLELQAFEKNYIIASAISNPTGYLLVDDQARQPQQEQQQQQQNTKRQSVQLPPFTILDLDKDVLPVAQSK